MSSIFYLNLATKNSHGKLRKFAFFLTYLVCPLLLRRREGSKRRGYSAVSYESGVWKTVYGCSVYKEAKEGRGHNAKQKVMLKMGLLLNKERYRDAQ